MKTRGSTTARTSEVERYYESTGWAVADGVTEDARRWEDLRPMARDYVAECRRRVGRMLPPSGTALLDIGSGPVQYPEYLEYSGGYEKRHCVDLSRKALDLARQRLEDHGVYHHGDFLTLGLPENAFDAAVCLHTIYHVPRRRQEAFVDEILRVLKPGGKAVIVTWNPLAAPSLLVAPIRWIRRAFGRRGFYFHAARPGWWGRFRDSASVRVLPWRVLGGQFQKRLIPSGNFGRRVLDLFRRIEESRRRPAVYFTQYLAIVLEKFDE